MIKKQMYKLTFKCSAMLVKPRTKAEQRTAADCTIVKPKYCQTQCYTAQRTSLISSMAVEQNLIINKFGFSKTVNISFVCLTKKVVE